MPSYYLLHPNYDRVSSDYGNPMGYLDTLTGLDPQTGDLSLWPAGQYIGGPFGYTDYNKKLRNSAVDVLLPNNP